MSAERVVVIIQARMGSQRFPGKMMARLNGVPLIDWVLRRCHAAQTADEVVLATTDLDQDTVLAEAAVNLGIPVYRGSSADVLGRYAEAAARHPADIVVRICADRPLVAPEVIDQAVTHYRRQHLDLAFNHIARPGANWPRGFGAEVLSRDLLNWLHDHALTQQHREHVTLYVWDHADRYRISPAPCPAALDPGYAGVALDVDLPEHLEKLNEICVGLRPEAAAADILAAWRCSRFAGQVDVA